MSTSSKSKSVERPASASPSRGHRVQRKPARPAKQKWLIALGVIVVLLVLVQVLGSPIAKSVVNRKLSTLPGFEGQAKAVKVALWRGAVEVDDLVIKERGHENDLPLLHLKKANFKFAPGALLTGKLGGSGLIDGVDLNIVKREAVDLDQAKNEVEETKEQIQHWQDVLRNAFPLALTRFEARNVHVRYVDRTHQPNVDVGIENMQIVATDLQNRPKANGDELPSRVDVNGVTTGGGKLKLGLRLDPIAQQPRFALNFQLLGQQLPPLNSLLLAYSDADVSRGTFEVYSEINAQNGAYDGYVKPLMQDLDFRTPSDKNKSLGSKVKEKVASVVASVMKNDDNQKVATKAPFAGNFADNSVDIWTTVVNLVRNAFVQAIRGGLDGQTPRR